MPQHNTHNTTTVDGGHIPETQPPPPHLDSTTTVDGDNGVVPKTQTDWRVVLGTGTFLILEVEHLNTMSLIKDCYATRHFWFQSGCCITIPSDP